jgi:glycine betaine/proline transport system permease protein
VLLAITLDRLTQALGRDAREKSARHWYETGPVGLVRGWLTSGGKAVSPSRASEAR